MRGQAVLGAVFACLFVAGLLGWSALALSGQGLRGEGWEDARAVRALAARSALEWSRWRLSADPDYVGLLSPVVSEAVPGPGGARVEFRCESLLQAASVWGPGVAVPPGLAAGLYVLPQGDFSPGDLRPLSSAGLAPVWSVDPAGVGMVEGSVFRALRNGTALVSVPAFSLAGGGELPVPEPSSWTVEVGKPPRDALGVGLSPRVPVVCVERPVLFTAVAWRRGKVWQAVGPDATFTLEGPGRLVPDALGVVYEPEGPGRAAVRVTVEKGGDLAADEVAFEVVHPARLCRVSVFLSGKEVGEAWILDSGGSARVLSWCPR